MLMVPSIQNCYQDSCAESTGRTVFLPKVQEERKSGECLYCVCMSMRPRDGLD